MTPADQLRLTATILRQDTERVSRTLDDWASTITPTSAGTGSKGGHSDPTATAALTPSRWAHLADEWHLYLGHLALLVGANIPEGLDHLAEAVEERRIKATSPTVRNILHHARIIIAIRDQATPIPPDLAAAEVAATRELEIARQYCAACATPGGPIRSGLCHPCYSLRTTWLGRGQPEMANPVTFETAVIAAIQAGQCVRPASPHSPHTRTKEHAA